MEPIRFKDVTYNYSKEYDAPWFKDRFKIDNPRTWPFFVIPMPVNKHGFGPCDTDEFDKMLYEVWDHCCDSYGSHEFLSDAIAQAIILSYELIKPA